MVTRSGPKNLPVDKLKTQCTIYLSPKTIEELKKLSKTDGIPRSQIIEDMVKRGVVRRINARKKHVVKS